MSKKCSYCIDDIHEACMFMQTGDDCDCECLERFDD